MGTGLSAQTGRGVRKYEETAALLILVFSWDLAP